jgi:hypothetical protein
MMDMYLFNTTARLTRRPDIDSPLPEFIDIAFNSSGQEFSMEYALQDILDLNDNPTSHTLQETYFLDLKNDSRAFFQLKDYRNNIRIAS